MREWSTHHLGAWLSHAVSSWPGKSRDFYAFGLGADYLRSVLGNELGNQLVFFQSPARRFHRGDREFMRVDREGRENRFRHQERVLRLAEMIFNMQRVDGLAERVDDLGAGHVQAVYAELEAGWHLYQRSFPFKYVRRCGKTGLDYDAELTWPGVGRVAIEMKCKLESTELSLETISNVLKAASKQLPKDGLGLVFLKIPELWVRNDALRATMNEALFSLFRQSRRVMAVVARWEDWRSIERGAVALYKASVVQSPRHREDVIVRSIVKRLDGPPSRSTVSFRSVVTDFLGTIPDDLSVNQGPREHPR
jgi:hypothetical protein